MSMQLTVRPDKSFGVVSSEVEKRLAKAAMGTARQISEEGKAAGRSAIAGAGFGPKWQSAFRSKVYPAGGSSLKPSVQFYHKIPYSRVFQTGKRIEGSPLLWLPLTNMTVARGGSKALTISQWEKVVGQKLVTINRPGQPPLLAARIRTTDKRLASKGVSLSLLKRGANIRVNKQGKVVRGQGTLRLVPMFIGIRAVNVPQKFDVVGAVTQAAARAQGVYSQILKELESDGG